MVTPFIGEIRMIGANFAPKNWALCNGQLVLINENPTLFSLLGAAFGGDERTNFGLPDLRGRTPVHPDSSVGFIQGWALGTEQVRLSVTEMGAHTHNCNAQSTTTTKRNPATGSELAQTNYSLYAAPKSLTTMAATAVTYAGSDEPHYNLQPSATINYIIALDGIYPQRP